MARLKYAELLLPGKCGSAAGHEEQMQENMELCLEVQNLCSEKALLTSVLEKHICKSPAQLPPRGEDPS